MGRHVNENFLNKFLGKNLLTEEQKIAIALKNRKENYVKAHFKRLEEKKTRTLRTEIREEITAAVNKVFYRTKEHLREAKQRGQQELVPYFTPYGILYFNKDTQEWTNTFGQIVDPMDFMTDFSFDDSSHDGDGTTTQNIIVPPLPVKIYPNPPKDLVVVSFDETGATLSWIDDSINEEGFKLFYYRATQFDPQPNTPPTPPSSFVSLGSSDTTVDIAWIDESINESGFKIYYREVINDDELQAPAAPTGFIAFKTETDTIQLQWVDVSQTEDGFKVFYLEPYHEPRKIILQ